MRQRSRLLCASKRVLIFLKLTYQLLIRLLINNSGSKKNHTNGARHARRYGVIKTFCPADGPASLRSYEYSRLWTTVPAAGKAQLEERPLMRLFHSVRRADFRSDKPIGDQQISFGQHFTIVCARACRRR